MAKTKEELAKLKEEYETLNSKLKELTEDEIKQVIGGTIKPLPDNEFWHSYNPFFYIVNDNNDNGQK